MWFFNKRSNKKPDGTIEYRDENGNLKEKWMPPEILDDLLKKSGAKRIHKVLVKYPSGEVKEFESTFFTTDMSKSVDENGFSYAMCHYENGEPKYTAIPKKFRERMDEAHEIMLDENLSEQQKAEALKKLSS